jgi:hypothetical protein
VTTIITSFEQEGFPKYSRARKKTQRMASALMFLERYHKHVDKFLSHIVQVTGEETWVSVVKVETKEQSKPWMHTHSDIQ